MANFDVWRIALGTSQGRIKPLGFVPSDGQWSLCLGYDSPGVKELLEVGDFVSFTQTGDFGLSGPAKIVRCQARIRPPAADGAGVAFEAQILVDGILQTTRRLEPGRRRDLADMACMVANLLPGAHDLEFRLTLVAT